MAEYQVLARKYRPRFFREILGQDAIVTTLKNAIKFQRIAHAYLFSGSRGTGKTSTARIFAKALNCLQPGADFEPCGECSSCREIASGHSLDVLEIDGASHRGIEDIRQINETAGYAAASGGYKIYIIDEVHMLTKEAFNALLKTLEEPPPRVKFFFATTEPHKVLPTNLTRCQRFHLNRLSVELMLNKLEMIAQELGVKVQEEALRMIVNRADGGLRDAESLFDQVIAFHQGEIDAEAVASVLGTMPLDAFFELDKAGKAGNLVVAFELVERVFGEGKDLVHFVESLVAHFRHLILVKLSGKDAPFISLSALERDKYEASAKLYTQEQCLTILDFLLEAQQQIRFAPSVRIALEAILLRIIRSHQRVPVDILVKRLSELEQSVASHQEGHPAPLLTEVPVQQSIAREVPPPAPPKPTVVKPAPVMMTEDPMPTPQELGKVAAPDLKKQSRYDTVLQFAAVELEGTIHKPQKR